MSGAPSAARVRLGIAMLEARLGWERSTISKKVRAGVLPRPHRLGTTRRFWWLEEIEEFERAEMERGAELHAKAAGRDPRHHGP